jgi:SAM-dependent methyltransferase
LGKLTGQQFAKNRADADAGKVVAAPANLAGPFVIAATRRVRFERGDAMNLPRGLGLFDAILLANLIDRLRDPRKCLDSLPLLLRPGGQLLVTSPWSWLVEYTARRCWLGGFRRKGRSVKTFDTLRQILSPHFRLVRRRDLPFLIREHARKFQLGLADASLWVRKDD